MTPMHAMTFDREMAYQVCVNLTSWPLLCADSNKPILTNWLQMADMDWLQNCTTMLKITHNNLKIFWQYTSKPQQQYGFKATTKRMPW